MGHLIVDNLEHQYGATPVLRGVSFSLRAGQIGYVASLSSGF
jgi:ABC-type histidine transport system ATPase subunit